MEKSQQQFNVGTVKREEQQISQQSPQQKTLKRGFKRPSQSKSPGQTQRKLPNLVDPVKIELKSKKEQQDRHIFNLKEQLERQPRITNLKEMETQIELIKVQNGIFTNRQRSAGNLQRKTSPQFQQQSSNLNQQEFNMTSRYNKTQHSQMFNSSQKDFQQNNNINELYDILSQQSKNKNGHKTSTFYQILSPHLKEFYQDKTHFKKVFEDYDRANYCMMEINEKIRCYRYELGNFVEKLGSSYYKIVETLLEATIKLHNDLKSKFENQIKENLDMIAKLVSEKKELETSNRKLKSQNVVSESLYKITKINSDALQNEVILLNDMLRKDVLSMVNHLSDVERQQQEQKEKLAQNNKADDPSEQLIAGLGNLNEIIDTMHNEQKAKDSFLNTMNGLLKAMLKGTKRDAFTQVDDGELLWNPSTVYMSNQQKLPYASDLSGMGINIDESRYGQSYMKNNIDAVKLKEKDPNNPQIQLKKQMNMQENWNLPVTLIVFLENVAKGNEAGRVIPWIHYRKMIFEIYKDYIANIQEINGALVTNCITMDEYLCLFMLKQHKLRRTAENKLFEFLVSLRYYCKNSPRANMFALFCNITSFPVQNIMEHQVFQRQNAIVETDTQTFLSKEAAEDIANQIMTFAQEQQRLRLIQRIEKLMAKNTENDPADHVDLDYYLELFIEEYMESRKKLAKNIAKEINKLQSDQQKIFSFESVKQVLKEISEQKSTIVGLSYPSIISITRTFLYTLTSDRNKFEVQAKELLSSCSRYGLDCPFPFIRTSTIYKQSEQNQLQQQEEGIVPQSNNNQIGKEGGNEKYLEQQNKIKIETSSSLFAQHFSILRELRNYCKNFKDAYEKEEDAQILWKQFANIINILDTGCQFLNFPINI